MSHPDPAFAWTDEVAMRAFVAASAFATIAAAVDGRPALAHAPLSVHKDGSVRFHLAKRNPLAMRLDGVLVQAGVLGGDFYVSPDWYGAPDQVPTWNYRLVEIEGVARRLTADELRTQIDAVSAAQEGLLAPKRPWTSAKMRPAVLEAMLGAIIGFAIDDSEFTGTAKLSQNKPAAMATGAMAALRELGRHEAAAAIEGVR